LLLKTQFDEKRSVAKMHFFSLLLSLKNLRFRIIIRNFFAILKFRNWTKNKFRKFPY
jgi:hypothetical protein